MHKYRIQGNEIFAPSYFRSIRPRYLRLNLKLGESQYLRLFLFKQNCVRANSRRGVSGCNCRRTTIPWGEIPLYTVIFFIHMINLRLKALNQKYVKTIDWKLVHR